MKKLSAVLMGLLVMVTLSGCGPHQHDGWFYETFTKPMDIFLKYIYDHVGSWGLSIVIITLIVRGIIMPFMLHNYKIQRRARIGQEQAKPELDVIQAKMKELKEKEARSVSREDKMRARTELMEVQRQQMAVMKKYNAMPLSIGGCLPMILQLPVISALYYVLIDPVYSKDITEAHFLGVFSLGTVSYILPLIAFAVYAVLTLMTTKLMPPTPQPGQEAMQNQMQMMQWLSPIMITIFSFWVAGAVAVYYIVGGLFMIFQTYIGYKIYPPYKPAKVKKEEYDPNKVTLVSKKKKK